MRQLTKSPSENIVKDIKCVTIVRQHVFSMCGRGVSSIRPKRRSESFWTASVARIAPLSCAIVRVSRGATITSGRRTAWKQRLANDTARAATNDEVKDLRREARDLKEVVAEIDAVVVRGDRQNLGHAKHCVRPDVLSL